MYISAGSSVDLSKGTSDVLSTISVPSLCFDALSREVIEEVRGCAVIMCFRGVLKLKGTKLDFALGVGIMVEARSEKEEDRGECRIPEGDDGGNLF